MNEAVFFCHRQTTNTKPFHHTFNFQNSFIPPLPNFPFFFFFLQKSGYTIEYHLVFVFDKVMICKLFHIKMPKND